mgnify:CR=1 FL=1
MVGFFGTDLNGDLYTHPGFIDVRMEVVKRFYIREKDAWSLKIRWVHKNGRPLSRYCRIKLTNKKWKEFRKDVNI